VVSFTGVCRGYGQKQKQKQQLQLQVDRGGGRSVVYTPRYKNRRMAVSTKQSKSGTSVKSRYFTAVGQFFVKTVADRHGDAAYHNNY